MAAKPKAFDDSKTYRMRVAYPVRVGPFKYLPRDEHEAAGSLLNRLVTENGPDVIATAEPV